jgi:uncharacterized protein YggE
MTRTGFAAMAAALILVAPAVAAPEAAPRVLTVGGLGTAKAAPDEASFSTGVVSQAPTARAALDANSRAMNAVIATLKKEGIAERAIQTSNLSLSPQYQACKPNAACPQKIVGYEVSNTVSVTVGLDKAGAVLDALVTSGSNRIDGISFSIHDTKPLLAAARADAVKDAMEKAQLYAKAAGVSLGPILAIDEGGSQAPVPIYKNMMQARAEFAPPVAGGEQSITANVSITWTIQ